MHLYDLPSPSDYDDGIARLEKSAYKGYVDAQRTLGLMLFAGSDHEYAEAVKWLQRAPDQGYIRSKNPNQDWAKLIMA